MTDPAEPTRYAFEYPDEAGYTDGIGTLSQDQAVLIDEVIDDPRAPAFDFYVVNDEKTGIYEAIVGDTEIAGLPTTSQATTDSCCWPPQCSPSRTTSDKRRTQALPGFFRW